MAWQSLLVSGISGEQQRWTQIASAVEGYKAQREASGYNRAQLRRLADLLKERIALTRRQGHQALSQHAGAVAGLTGQQRAAFAASGVKVDTGSAEQVRQQTQAAGEQDAMTIRENTQLQIKSLETELQNVVAQHRLSKKRDKQARKMMYASLATSIFGTNSSFSTGLYNYFGGK